MLLPRYRKQLSQNGSFVIEFAIWLVPICVLFVAIHQMSLVWIIQAHLAIAEQTLIKQEQLHIEDVYELREKSKQYFFARYQLTEAHVQTRVQIRPIQLTNQVVCRMQLDWILRPRGILGEVRKQWKVPVVCTNG